jgi:AAA15 family ATPase/GTPase
LGIEDILVEKKPIDSTMWPDDMPESMKKELSGKLQGKEFLKIKAVHKNTESEYETFDFEDESDGTQKLFAFAGPWIDSLANGYVLFIDELHDNLHPRLVRFLVQLFHSSKTNPKNAQLVFTTHETSILNQEVFRRDQVWFCEKNQQQATILYPLTDFSPRKGRENLELAYLSGRYGALPYVRPLRKHG